MIVMTQVRAAFCGFDDKVALGKRLRQLSEMTDRDARRLYQSQDIAFEQRWFGVLNQLVLNGPMSVGDLAKALGITHASVSETRRSLIKEALICAEADPFDSRRRVLKLTSKGRRQLNKMEPIFRALEETSEELNLEANNVIAALDGLLSALDRESLFERASNKIREFEREDQHA